MTRTILAFKNATTFCQALLTDQLLFLLCTTPKGVKQKGVNSDKVTNLKWLEPVNTFFGSTLQNTTGDVETQQRLDSVASHSKSQTFLPFPRL